MTTSTVQSTRSLRVLLFLFAAMAAALATAGAAAQERPANEGRDSASESPVVGAPQEVIVTARRREERIQDVPLAVTSVSADVLEQQAVVDVGQLTKVAPSLVVLTNTGGGRSQPTFSIRGLSQQEQAVIGDQSVSTYLGDVVLARVYGINGALFDIESVQVLRGPQGTLFGRNTTGGAVIIRPYRPSDRFEANVGITAGDFDTLDFRGMVNLPVADALGLRLAGMIRKDDGYVYDELLGRNINETDQQAARASILFQLPGDGDVLTAYDYFNDDGGSTPGLVRFMNPAGSFNGAAFRAARGYRPIETLYAEQQARGNYRIATGTPLFNKIRTHTVANTATVPLSESMTLKNIVGYRTAESELRDDPDGTESSMFPQERNDIGHQFSEEFQVLGDGDRLDWITGLFYFRESGRTQAESYGGAVDPGAIEPVHVEDYPGPAYSITDVAGINKSYAVFAQGTYAMTERLNLTVGARYTKDEREATIRNRLRSGCRFTLDLDNNPATPETPPPLSQCELTSDANFSEPTYNLSLDYELADSRIVYLAHRHGYRSGGFGSRATTQAGLSRTFKPESVDDVELGLKADWHPADTFLRTNFAAYYMEFDDIQRILTDPNVTPVTAVTTNAGKARIQGIEADLLFRPIESLELSANYAYTDAKFTEFIAPDGRDLSNAPFARAPKNVYTLGARFWAPVSESVGEVSLGASYFHIDDYNGNDDYVAGFTDVEGYETVGLDASWDRVMGSNFDVAAYVTNLTDEDYTSLFVNLNGLGFTTHVAGEPRRFGVTVRYRFDR